MIWALVTALEFYLLAPAVRLLASVEWSREPDRSWERYVYISALLCAILGTVLALAIDGQSTDSPWFLVKSLVGIALLATRSLQCAEEEIQRGRRRRMKPPRAALLYAEPRASKDMTPSEYDADFIEQASVLGLKVFQCVEPVLGGFRYSLYLTRGPEVPIKEIVASRFHHLVGGVPLEVGRGKSLELRRWGDELQAVVFDQGERVTGILPLPLHEATSLDDGQCLASGPLVIVRQGERLQITLFKKPFGSSKCDDWFAALIRAAEQKDEGPTIESGEGVFAFPLKTSTQSLKVERIEKSAAI